MTDPRHTHEFEQFMAASRELAATLATYMDELVKNGCSRGEALILASQMQLALLSGPPEGHGEDWRGE